jgi:hypothetical protein
MYVCWRLVSQPLPSLRHEAFALSLLVAAYLSLQGAILVFGGGNFIIILLQGQWVAYFLTGLFLAYDIARTPGGLPFLSSSIVGVAAAAAACGIISVWTGPFFEYGHHAAARWGLPVSRAIGTFDSPGGLGAVLGLAFIFEYLSGARASFARRCLTLALIAVTLVLTFSKGAIIATLVSAAAGGILAAARSGANARNLAVLRLAGVCSLTVIVLWLANTYDIDVVQLIRVDAQGHSEIGMEVLNEYSADDLLSQLFGIGFRQSAKLYSDELIWITAHNSFISLLREIGGVGTCLFAALVLSLLVRLSSGRHLTWECALLGILLLSLSETCLYSSYLVLFIGGAAGLVCAQPQSFADRAFVRFRPQRTGSTPHAGLAADHSRWVAR